MLIAIILSVPGQEQSGQASIVLFHQPKGATTVELRIAALYVCATSRGRTALATWPRRFRHNLLPLFGVTDAVRIITNGKCSSVLDIILHDNGQGACWQWELVSALFHPLAYAIIHGFGAHFRCLSSVLYDK